MSRRKSAKPYWEMTTKELAEATKEFDEEFVADKGRPLTPQMQLRWERAKAKARDTQNGAGQKTIVVRLEKTLLKRCIALARKKHTSRKTLIAQGLKALLAAEGLG